MKNTTKLQELKRIEKLIITTEKEKDALLAADKNGSERHFTLFMRLDFLTNKWEEKLYN